MAYVINDSCIKCKYMDCVEVCPVDAFYEGETMLAINPDECIDCGVCEPECPTDAIIPDSEPSANHWLEINRRYSAVWPSVTRKHEPPADADQWKGMPSKFDKFFSDAPGPGRTSGG
jgi:ferredoxin